MAVRNEEEATLNRTNSSITIRCGSLRGPSITPARLCGAVTLRVCSLP